MNSMETTTSIRVRYAETDAMGIVHHAVYPVWMELGRSDFLRELGQSYSEWEARGVSMSVGEIKVRYRSPARYDELVEIRTRLREHGRRKVIFEYDIVRGGVKLAEGESTHIVTGPDGRSRVMPDDLLKFLETGLG
jgi:acyl-CoA thioester hydrolase